MKLVPPQWALNTCFNMKRALAILITILSIASGCKQVAVVESKMVPEIENSRGVKIMSAFFGLDNGLTAKALRISTKAYHKDGMPIVLSQEIDPETLDASDFEITTQNGSKHIPIAVSLLPANEAFELRTILLIGEYGSSENQPATVKIIDNLMSRSGKNFKGQEQQVIRLEAGPILSYAEYFSFTKDYPYVKNGRGCDCPRDETQMVVKVVWSGGVRSVNEIELGDRELKDFKITMVNGSDTTTVNPFKLADLNDNDNNIDLCLKERGIPIFVEVNEGIAIDPNGDRNPKTQIDVLSRW